MSRPFVFPVVDNHDPLDEAFVFERRLYPYRVRYIMKDQAVDIWDGMKLDERLLNAKNIDQYTFMASCNVSAKRIVMRWFRKKYPGHTWTRMPDLAETKTSLFIAAYNPEYPDENMAYVAAVGDGLLIVASTGEILDEDDFQELKKLIRSIRINRNRIWEQFSSNPGELIDRLGRYYRYWNEKLAGRWMYELAEDMNLIYDWPGVPEMLSRALNMPPQRLRIILGKTRFLVCPKCGNEGPVGTERIQGGYKTCDYLCGECFSMMTDDKLGFQKVCLALSDPDDQGIGNFSWN